MVHESMAIAGPKGPEPLSYHCSEHVLDGPANATGPIEIQLKGAFNSHFLSSQRASPQWGVVSGSAAHSRHETRH
jgi:hypothetical protein